MSNPVPATAPYFYEVRHLPDPESIDSMLYEVLAQSPDDPAPVQIAQFNHRDDANAYALTVASRVQTSHPDSPTTVRLHGTAPLTPLQWQARVLADWTGPEFKARFPKSLRQDISSAIEVLRNV